MYSLKQKQYATQASVDSFNHELMLRLRQLPGTQSIGLANTVPMIGNNNNNGFVVEGYVQPKGPLVNLAEVTNTEGITSAQWVFRCWAEVPSTLATTPKAVARDCESQAGETLLARHQSCRKAYSRGDQSNQNTLHDRRRRN